MTPVTEKADKVPVKNDLAEPVKLSADRAPSAPQRITILSELDSYIAERMKEQPASLEEAVKRIEVQAVRARHRLNLPDYFERQSADSSYKGAYAFRWVLKNKRSVDDHLAKGWLFVNQSYFPQAPRYLFTANGGIEIGDCLLAFIPIKKALQIRRAPAELSQARLKGQMVQTAPDYVLMNPNKDADHIYQPKLGDEADETGTEKVPGVLTQGRDF